MNEIVSVAVIGDTQMMTEPAPKKLAGVFANETAWLQANASSLNLKFVVQLGDLTNGTYKVGGYTKPSTNSLGLTEMAYAKEAMDKLWLPASGRAIPWTVSLGNHDIDEWCWGEILDTSKVSNDPRCSPGGGVIINGGGTSRTTTNFSNTFARSYFTSMPTWGGSSSESNIDDNYHRFTVGTQSWLIVSLMWAPQQADFDWANKIIDSEVATDSSTRVIVATHGFMDPLWDGDPQTLRAGVADGNARELYDGVLRAHPQIRLVLGGHWSMPTPRVADRQCRDRSVPLTFSPCKWVRKNTVNVPADGSIPAFTFHTLLTDYSDNGDPNWETFYVAPTDSTLAAPATVTRAITDNAFFRLLTFDSSDNTIHVRTVTSPSNLQIASPLPQGCAPVSLSDLGISAPVCGKTDGAYGTSQDDYTLNYK